MKKPVFLIAVNACLLLAIFAWLAQSLRVVERAAQTQNVQGQVSLQRGGRGSFVPLKAGATVAMGDVVRTGSKSGAEFKWRGGTRWKLGPDSQLTVKSAVVDSDKNSELTQLQLAQGQMWVRATSPLSADSRFEILTPTVMAQVHGTVFGIKVVGDATQVKVFRGEVDVRAEGGNEASISDGKTALVTTADVRIAPSDSQDDFLAQKSLIAPQLDVSVQQLSKTKAAIYGETEADDVVRIDGKTVPVERTGLFKLEVPLKKGANAWQIESTDKHGQKSVVPKSLNIAVTPESCPKTAAQFSRKHSVFASQGWENELAMS